MSLGLRGLAAASCLFILSACGGGGGGSGGTGGGSGNAPPPAPDPSGYVGATTAADLTSSSVVPPLSGWLLLELGLSYDLNSSSGGIVATKTSRATALSSKMAIQAVTTESCSVSGTVETNDDGLNADGIGVVVFTFRDCAEGGRTLNGVGRMTVAARDTLSREPTDYTLTFEKLRISGGTTSIEANGSTRIVVAGSTVTTTRNTIARYLPENVDVRLENFVEVETASNPDLDVTYQGRFCQSQYGCVDVSTPAHLSIDDQGATNAGRMLLTSGASRVELRFREEYALSIAIDADGDGTVERGTSALHPVQLLGPIGNFLPMVDAGPDLMVFRDRLVTLGASGNAWDGSPVSYSWSFVTVPWAGGSSVVGQGPTFAFTPTVNGTYVVRLTVTDGSGLAAGDLVTIVVRDAPITSADAGAAIWTMVGSTVTLDASGSSGALQFEWSRVAAPAGSAAATTLTGVRPQLAIDLAGSYRYSLTVTGPGGVSTDEVWINAQSLLFASNAVFLIGPDTQAAATAYEMEIELNSAYSGAPVSLAISSNVDWLTVDTPNVTIASSMLVTLRLDLDVLESLPNGRYTGVVRIASANTEVSKEFSLGLHLPQVQQVSPYVVYTGQPTTVNLSGEISSSLSSGVVVGGEPAQSFTRVNESMGRADLPALTPGEYTVRATNALGLERPGARLVVRDPPAHPDSEVTLPARPYSLEYDPERDVFYGVFGTDAGTYSAQRFYRLANGTWQFDAIAVPNPRALTLALGGERLLVTSGDCGVYEIDSVMLQTLTSELQPGCVPEDFSLIGALANGDALVANIYTQANVRRYHALAYPYPLLPDILAPVAVVSNDRSRMLWAQSSLAPQPGLWVLDALGASVFPSPTVLPVTVSQSQPVFLRSNLAISGDGSRFMHGGDVYDNSYQYAGALPGLDDANITSAISRRGTRAVVYNNDTDELMLFDVSTGNSFPSLGFIDTFAEEISAAQVTYFPDDTAVFISGVVQTSEASEYRLLVRQLP